MRPGLLSRGGLGLLGLHSLLHLILLVLGRGLLGRGIGPRCLHGLLCHDGLGFLGLLGR